MLSLTGKAGISKTPSDSIAVDEGHRCGADSLTDDHLSLREKMPLVDVDLALMQSSTATGTSGVVDS